MGRLVTTVDIDAIALAGNARLFFQFLVGMRLRISPNSKQRIKRSHFMRLDSGRVVDIKELPHISLGNLESPECKCDLFVALCDDSYMGNRTGSYGAILREITIEISALFHAEMRELALEDADFHQLYQNTIFNPDEGIFEVYAEQPYGNGLLLHVFTESERLKRLLNGAELAFFCQDFGCKKRSRGLQPALYARQQSFLRRVFSPEQLRYVVVDVAVTTTLMPVRVAAEAVTGTPPAVPDATVITAVSDAATTDTTTTTTTTTPIADLASNSQTFALFLKPSALCCIGKNASHFNFHPAFSADTGNLNCRRVAKHASGVIVSDGGCCRHANFYSKSCSTALNTRNLSSYPELGKAVEDLLLNTDSLRVLYGDTTLYQIRRFFCASTLLTDEEKSRFEYLLSATHIDSVIASLRFYTAISKRFETDRSIGFGYRAELTVPFWPADETTLMLLEVMCNEENFWVVDGAEFTASIRHNVSTLLHKLFDQRLSLSGVVNVMSIEHILRVCFFHGVYDNQHMLPRLEFTKFQLKQLLTTGGFRFLRGEDLDWINFSRLAVVGAVEADPGVGEVATGALLRLRNTNRFGRAYDSESEQPRTTELRAWHCLMIEAATRIFRSPTAEGAARSARMLVDIYSIDMIRLHINSALAGFQQRFHDAGCLLPYIRLGRGARGAQTDTDTDADENAGAAAAVEGANGDGEENGNSDGEDEGRAETMAVADDTIGFERTHNTNGARRNGVRDGTRLSVTNVNRMTACLSSILTDVVEASRVQSAQLRTHDFVECLAMGWAERLE